MVQRRTAILGALLLILALWLGWTALKQQQARWYLGQVPAYFQVDGVAEVSTTQSLKEGCGAAVFVLKAEQAQALGQQGLQALQQARQARAHPETYFSYSAWQETPYIETGEGMSQPDRWLNGLSCAGLSDELADVIQAAIAVKGAYYARSAEGGLIIIPAKKLAVLSFDG